MGLNYSQTTLFSQKQGWKCVCDGLKLKNQTEEKKETEFSSHVPPGWTEAMGSVIHRDTSLVVPSPKKKSIKPTSP